MANGMVLRGRWTLEELQGIMRHKEAKTTKDAYVTEGLRPDTQSRWISARIWTSYRRGD